MPPVAAQPLFMKQAVLTLTFAGAVDYACHVNRAELVPSPGKATTFTPLCPDGAVTEFGADTFVLALEGVQDWSADGLARLLWENAGDEIPFALNAYGTAPAADTPSMTGTVVVVRPPYGGSAEAFAELDLELPVVGVPVLDTTP